MESIKFPKASAKQLNNNTDKVEKIRREFEYMAQLEDNTLFRSRDMKIPNVSSTVQSK